MGFAFLGAGCGGGESSGDTEPPPASTADDGAETSVDDPGDSGDGAPATTGPPDGNDDEPADVADERLASRFPLLGGVTELPDTIAGDLIQAIRGEVASAETTAEEVAAIFSPGFLAEAGVPATVAQLETLRADGFADAAPVEVITSTPYTATVILAPGPSFPFLVDVIVDPDTDLVSTFTAPLRARGLARLVGNPTLAEEIELFTTLSPDASALVAEIGPDGECVSLAGADESVRRGIASNFKVWVLGAIARAIEAGDLARDDVVVVNPGDFISGGSLVLGGVTEPVELTVQELANLMMGVSDNAATDALHGLVSRDLLDETVREFGHAEPDAMTPVLSLSEFAHLYGTSTSAEVDAYLSGNEEAQQQFAETLRARGRYANGTTGNPPVPRLSWQASPADLCAAMAALRGFPEGAEASALIEEAYGSSAGTTGLRNQWDRVWYKGGNHPGVTAGTTSVFTLGWLVENEGGPAYAVILFSNSDEGLPDETIFSEVGALAGRIHQILLTS